MRPLDEALVREIRTKRARINMSQGDLALHVGVSPTWLSQILKDPQKLHVATLIKLIDVLDLDIDIVLRWLRYSPRSIKKFKSEGEKP